MIVKSPKPAKKNLRDIRKDLRVIYQGRDGGAPDMSRLTSRKQSSLHGFLVKAILVLLVLSAAAWSGFFLFSNGLFQKQDSLAVKIDGPTDVKAGQTVTYNIHYENTGNVPLAALSLSANFPQTFHIKTSVPEASDKNMWNIGALTPKSDGVIVVNGIFLADVPSIQQWQAVFTYKPANFNSSFQQVETEKVNINDSILNLSVNGPEQALPGDSVTYTITLANTDTAAAANLRIMPALPPDFSVTSTDPAFESSQTYWNLASLDPNQPKTYTIIGTFTAASNGSEAVGANAGFVEDDVYLKQKDATASTTIQGSAIGFHLIVNGSDQNQSVGAGQFLHGSINYADQGTDPIGDVQFALTLDDSGKPLPIDWNKATLQGGKQNGNEIDWNKDTTPDLASLNPTDSGVISFSLPIPTSIDAGAADHFTMKLTTTIGKLKDASAPRTIESTPFTVSINSNVSFQPEARYYTESGVAVGSGSLPPKVGKTTTYRVYWNVTNSLHDLSNVKVSATLPSNVTWTDKQLTDIGALMFNTTTRTITWSIDKLPSSIPKAGAWFDVSINPKAADVGKILPLTSASSFTAKDSKTNESLSSSSPNLTTELPTDTTANGKGAVVK